MDARVVLAVLMVIAIVVILFAFFGRRDSSSPIREVIVREEVPVAWLPWSWGYGWGGWSGTTYVDRPFPRFPWRPRGGDGGGHHLPPPSPGSHPGPRPPAPPSGGPGSGGDRPGGGGHGWH